MKPTLTKKQQKEFENALIEFAIRVLKGETTSEKEIEILPEVVNTIIRCGF